MYVLTKCFVQKKKKHTQSWAELQISGKTYEQILWYDMIMIYCTHSVNSTEKIKQLRPSRLLLLSSECFKNTDKTFVFSQCFSSVTCRPPFPPQVRARQLPCPVRGQSSAGKQRSACSYWRRRWEVICTVSIMNATTTTQPLSVCEIIQPAQVLTGSWNR